MKQALLASGAAARCEAHLNCRGSFARQLQSNTNHAAEQALTGAAGGHWRTAALQSATELSTRVQERRMHALR